MRSRRRTGVAACVAEARGEQVFAPLSTSPLCQTHASRYMLFFQAHITHMDMDMDMDMNTDMDMDMDMDMGLWPSGTFPSYI
jgi:hypothetical protein